MKMWALKRRNGVIAQWAGCHSRRKNLIAIAVQGSMGATDYHRLGNDAARWRYCYANGNRIVRVTVAEAQP